MPSGEISDLALSRQSLEYRMSRIVASEYKNYEELITDMEAAIKEMLSNGYQIVPVKVMRCEEK